MTASNAKRTFPDTSPPHRNTSDVNLPRSAIRTQDDREGVKRRGLDRSGHGQIVIRLPGTRHASVLNISTLGHANGLGTPTSHSPTRIDHDKLSPMLISPNAQQFTNTNVTSEGSAYARLSSAPDPLRLSAPLLSPNDMSHYTRMDNNDNDRHQYYHHYHQHQNTNNHNNNNTNTSQYPPTSIQSYPSRGLTTAPTGSADKNLRGIQSRPRGHSMHASSSPFYPAPLADGLKIYSNRHSRAGSAGVSANLHYDANPFIQRRTSLMAEYQANTSTSNSMPRSNPSSVERPLETYHDTATSIQPHTLLYANSPRRHSSRRRATHEPSVSPTRHTRGDAMGPQTSPLRPVSYNTPALSLHFRRDRTPVVHDSLTSAPTVPPEPESPVYNRGIRSRSMQPIDEHLSLHPDRHSHGDGRSRLLPLQGWQQEAALALQESPSGLTTQPDHFPSYTANTSVPPMHSRHYENRPHMSMPVSFMAPTTILHSGAIDTSTHRRRATTGNPLPVTAAATMPPVASLSPRQAIAHESFQGQRRSSEQSPAQQITLPRLSTENLAMHYAQQMAAQNATLPTLPTMMMELDTTHRGWTARSPMAGTSALPLTAAATALATTTTHPQHGPQLHPVISQATPSTQLWSAEDRRQMDQLHKSLQL
ncbi:hypothetical protein BDF19DRAFT_207867 [Syncephalis fuscata]|nr:hypothetical protein BDF19DRAFT_207867 [Syncephalis fuscata]